MNGLKSSGRYPASGRDSWESNPPKKFWRLLRQPWNIRPYIAGVTGYLAGLSAFPACRCQARTTGLEPRGGIEPPHPRRRCHGCGLASALGILLPTARRKHRREKEGKEREEGAGACTILPRLYCKSRFFYFSPYKGNFQNFICSLPFPSNSQGLLQKNWRLQSEILYLVQLPRAHIS